MPLPVVQQHLMIAGLTRREVGPTVTRCRAVLRSWLFCPWREGSALKGCTEGGDDLARIIQARRASEGNAAIPSLALQASMRGVGGTLHSQNSRFSKW